MQPGNNENQSQPTADDFNEGSTKNGELGGDMGEDNITDDTKTSLHPEDENTEGSSKKEQ